MNDSHKENGVLNSEILPYTVSHVPLTIQNFFFLTFLEKTECTFLPDMRKMH